MLVLLYALFSFQNQFFFFYLFLFIYFFQRKWRKISSKFQPVIIFPSFMQMYITALSAGVAEYSWTKIVVSIHRKAPIFFPGGVLRYELDRGVPLEPQNPYPSLRVILAEKGTHF